MTTFTLRFTIVGSKNLFDLENDPSKSKQLKAIRKALSHLQQNPRHPSLNTHKYESLSGECGVEVFEAYAENNTPQAHRIFWHYGPKNNEITILAITPHP